LIKESNTIGYKLYYNVINTAFYGIPQTRERFICVGVKKGLPEFKYPKETHYDPDNCDKASISKKKKWVTCKDVIADLDYDTLEDTSMVAGSKHKDLLKQIPPGDNYLFFTKERNYSKPIFKWRSRYWSFLLKLSPDRPSWTIQASHSNNMGPFHWKNRFLRIAEIKRLQTFDDNYKIYGDYKTQWRQIGNAVPPKIAELFAREIKKQLLKNK
jgi:DNA (cytosine-5)-methyltransferase 1